MYFQRTGNISDLIVQKENDSPWDLKDSENKSSDVVLYEGKFCSSLLAISEKYWLKLGHIDMINLFIVRVSCTADTFHITLDLLADFFM